jgi:hypothetical protein
LKQLSKLAVMFMAVVAIVPQAFAGIATEGPPKLTFEPLKYESIQNQPPPADPFGLEYQVATDGEAYTLASYVIERGILAPEISLVLVAGYRVRDWAGATGGGLEYQKKLGSGYGKAGFYIISVQSEKLKGVFGLSYKKEF